MLETNELTITHQINAANGQETKDLTNRGSFEQLLREASGKKSGLQKQTNVIDLLAQAGIISVRVENIAKTLSTVMSLDEQIISAWYPIP